MATGVDRTLSQLDGTGHGGAARRGSFLFLVLAAHRPLSSPARVSLAKVDEIVVGRGAPSIRREGRRVEVRCDDPWMSSTHARLTSVMGKWTFEDARSKNGSFVNGEPASHQIVTDGDVIELGRTFFILREDVEVAGDPDELPAGPRDGALRTLLPHLAATFERLEAIARSEVTVLVQGASGTGKELAARAVHELSGRRGRFVAVNCGALPATLVESELFGHRKGAFSGAVEDRPGLVRSADGGTLFLDEIGDLPAPSQTALLRVLEQREVQPVGDTRPHPVDLRVVAATHRDLEAMVAAGDFREDLLARLSGFRFELPPLAERREDLGLVIATLLRRAGGESITFHPRAARALLRHDWPRNVRELEKALASARVLAGASPITPEHLPDEVQRGPTSRPAARLEAKDQAHRAELEALLREHGGNVAAVSRAVGKAPIQLRRWFKRYGIDPDAFRR